VPQCGATLDPTKLRQYNIRYRCGGRLGEAAAERQRQYSFPSRCIPAPVLPQPKRLPRSFARCLLQRYVSSTDSSLRWDGGHCRLCMVHLRAQEVDLAGVPMRFCQAWAPLAHARRQPF
jgi:hypothetical protein